MYGTTETKAVVSISEMARMVGLSRSRFHQLIGTTFPWPLYSVSTKRPFYDEDVAEIAVSKFVVVTAASTGSRSCSTPGDRSMHCRYGSQRSRQPTMANMTICSTD